MRKQIRPEVIAVVTREQAHDFYEGNLKRQYDRSDTKNLFTVDKFTKAELQHLCDTAYGVPIKGRTKLDILDKIRYSYDTQKRTEALARGLVWNS